MRLLPLALGATFLFCLPHSAFAATAIDSGDAAWILTGAGADDDIARSGVVLRRLGSGEECRIGFDASFCRCLFDVDIMDGCRIFAGIFRRWRLGWQSEQYVSVRAGF